MSKISLKERVLAELKCGDEAKLTKFEVKLEKYYNKQKKIRQEDIEKLDDQIDDANDKLQTIIKSPSIEALQIEGGASYCPTYFDKVQTQMDIISRMEEKKEMYLAEIDKLTKVYDAIYPEA